MITILKNGYDKIMQIFWKNKQANLHLREIARLTKLHEPSTTKILNDLEKEHILISEWEGNQKKYSIKKNKKTYLLFEIYDMTKFEKLPTIRKDAIKYYLNKLTEKPIYIILFGSSAKETYTEESDMDIVIVTNRKIDVKDAETEANNLTGIKISTFQIKYNEFVLELKLRKDKVISSAVNTGYPLINHISYYEELYDEKI